MGAGAGAAAPNMGAGAVAAGVEAPLAVELRPPTVASASRWSRYCCTASLQSVQRDPRCHSFSRCSRNSALSALRSSTDAGGAASAGLVAGAGVGAGVAAAVGAGAAAAPKPKPTDAAGKGAGVLAAAPPKEKPLKAGAGAAAAPAPKPPKPPKLPKPPAGAPNVAAGAGAGAAAAAPNPPMAAGAPHEKLPAAAAGAPPATRFTEANALVPGAAPPGTRATEANGFELEVALEAESALSPRMGRLALRIWRCASTACTRGEMREGVSVG